MSRMWARPPASDVAALCCDARPAPWASTVGVRSMLFREYGTADLEGAHDVVEANVPEALCSICNP